MKTVTLWGYYGYGNVGDEAILASMLNLLGDVKVNLISGPTPSVEESENLRIIPRGIRRLVSSISKSNGFVLGGGGLVHDRINAKSTWYHLLGPSFSRFTNKPVAAIGQQIGPFYRNFTKKLVRYSLSKATLTVRDQKSFSEAKLLGLNPILSADMAFLLKIDEPSVEIAEKIKKLPKPVIIFAPGIDPRWTPTPERSAKILEHFQKKTGGSVLFVPFFPVRDDDYIDEVQKIRKIPGLVLKSPISWRDAFGCFLLSDISIPMRLHAMIASALAGLPMLPIPYYPKVPMIASDLGVTSLLTHDDPNWQSKCDNFLKNMELVAVAVKNGAKKMADRAESSRNVLDTFINGLG
ncbi:MAG: polysaccharide pyruvyl transferase family protein [Caldisericia bacterium]|nr:polysaccharide pyruvyl transferase family protein [Caldisericia bacterium]